MLAILAISASSVNTSSSDLYPPFIIGDGGKIGQWELGGKAMISTNDSILLVPPIQFSRGCAWTCVDIAQSEWSVQFELQMSSGSGGGIGIWYADKYGADGPLLGGPAKFRGFALLCTMETFENDVHELQFYFIQNRGLRETEIESMQSPNFTVLYDQSNRFSVDIAIINDLIEVSVSPDSISPLRTMLTVPVAVDFARNYVGVTAQTDSYVSRIDLLSATFNADLSERKGGSLKSKGKYAPQKISLLRNPSFSQTYLEIVKKAEDPSAEASIFDILTVIGEAAHAANDIANFHELNQFVSSTVLPYVEKWHRRTFKMVDTVRALRSVSSAAWSYTQTIMNDFNRSLIDAKISNNANIQELIKDFISEGQNRSDANVGLHSIKMDAKKVGTSDLLMAACISELCVVLVVLVLMSFSFFRATLMRRD